MERVAHAIEIFHVRIVQPFVAYNLAYKREVQSRLLYRWFTMFDVKTLAGNECERGDDVTPVTYPLIVTRPSRFHSLLIKRRLVSGVEYGDSRGNC